VRNQLLAAQVPQGVLKFHKLDEKVVLEVEPRRTHRTLEVAYLNQTDATGVKVLDPESPENIQRGTMWCCVGDERNVVFRYTPTGEGARGPWEFLAGRTGYVQADAASVFDRLFNGRVASAVEVGCWSHSRRKLTELQDMDCRVAYPLKLIARLYRIEHLADASDLAKAAAYMINHWAALTRFLQDGRLKLDNNLCEQQLRAIALGRNNFLFFGSHRAAERAAVLYSLTRTCALQRVSPLSYLANVLRKLAAGWPQSRIDELLPGGRQPATVAS
jgi:transposase